MSTLTVQPSIDAYIEGTANPNTNYGANTKIYVAIQYTGPTKSFWFRTIVNFDISAIPAGSTIDAAQLRFVIGAPTVSAEAQLQRCTRPATWVESQATWNNYKTGSAWTAGGGDKDTGVTVTDTMPGTGTWTIATSASLVSLVQDALDNRSSILSLILFLSDEAPGSNSGGGFYSSEGATPPELDVDYTAPATPSLAPPRKPINAIIGR